MRSLRAGSAGIVVLLVLAACGGTDGTGSKDRAEGDRPPASAIDPSELPSACELLVEADVEAAFGEPVTAGTQSTDECWWFSANDLKTVNLIRRTGDPSTWRDGYDNEFWAPNDFGDEGYTGKVFDSIVWRIGDVQYEVNVVYSTRGDPDAVVRDLAGKAAARL